MSSRSITIRGIQHIVDARPLEIAIVIILHRLEIQFCFRRNSFIITSGSIT